MQHTSIFSFLYSLFPSFFPFIFLSICLLFYSIICIPSLYIVISIFTFSLHCYISISSWKLNFPELVILRDQFSPSPFLILFSCFLDFIFALVTTFNTSLTSYVTYLLKLVIRGFHNAAGTQFDETLVQSRVRKASPALPAL